jgi:hypothetical protein
MSTLELAFSDGQWAALERFKLAMPKATPTVSNSTLLSGAAPKPELPPSTLQQLQPPTTPTSIRQVFDVQEQAKTRIEPHRKMAADICTSCRKERHYGPCTKPKKTRPHGEPLKRADFNPGMRGDDPQYVGDSGNPSTSPHYHSAVSAVGSLSRSSDSRPPADQAASGFADLYRHQGISNVADEPGRMYGGLTKTCAKLADFFLPGSEGHSWSENRGPSVNPYEERRTRKSPPVGWGPEGLQQIERSFASNDIGANTDAGSIGGR